MCAPSDQPQLHALKVAHLQLLHLQRSQDLLRLWLQLSRRLLLQPAGRLRLLLLLGGCLLQDGLPP